nr:isochorismatase family protein [Rothia sp. ZJ1223]
MTEFNRESEGLGWSFDSSRVALLVHDFLPYYLQVLTAQLQEELIKSVQIVVDWAQQNGVPVVRSAPRPATAIEQRGIGGKLWGLGPTASQVNESLVQALDDVPCVYKRSLSAFYATDLDVELRRLGRNQLAVVGIFASGGIIATSFDALARDIEYFVVADAIADYSAERHLNVLRLIGASTGQVINLQELVTKQ